MSAHLLGYGGSESGLDDVLELVHVVCDTTASSTQGEGWPDDEGEGNLLRDLVGLRHVAASSRGGRLQPNALHGLLEQLAIFCLVDGVQLGPDQLHSILGKNARLQDMGTGVKFSGAGLVSGSESG